MRSRRSRRTHRSTNRLGSTQARTGKATRAIPAYGEEDSQRPARGSCRNLIRPGTFSQFPAAGMTAAGYLAGMNGGPTARIVFLLGSVSAAAAGGGAAGAACAGAAV